MNKRQAEVVTNMLSEGFVDEALVLAKAYTDEAHQEVTADKKVAEDDQPLITIRGLLAKFFPIVGIAMILDKIMKRVLSKEEIISVNTKKVVAKVTAMLMALISILVPLIMYFLLMSPADRALEKKNFARRKKYETMAWDNLDEMKRKMSRMMGQR